MRVLSVSTHTYLLSLKIAQSVLREIAVEQPQLGFYINTPIDKMIRKMRDKDLVVFKDIFLMKMERVLTKLVVEVRAKI
jgi:hypothetical protein